MSTYVPTERIRTVVLLGPGGVGKTTLAEQVLTACGLHETRGGRLDTEPEERDRGHTLGLQVATCAWREHRITILDTPGMSGVAGDAYPALSAADLAVFVVDASTGIGPLHEQLWEACDEIGLPRLVFLNKLDRQHASYQRTVDALRERYGKRVAPVEMPVDVEQHFTGVIDLLHMTAWYAEGDGEAARAAEVPDARRDQAERNRETLVEAIVENDDDLLLRYLDGDVPDAKELAACFAHGIARGGFFPVLCGAATTGLGVHGLLDFLVEEGPSPAVRAQTQDRDLDAPTALWVAKTLSDPFVGHINVLRVMSGTLVRDDELTVQRTGDTVRLHQLFSLVGSEQTPVDRAAAGDIVAVAKLSDVRTGDLLADSPGALAPPTVPAPEPYHRIALEPASVGDEDKLSGSLARLVEEDPSLRVEHRADTNQLLLSAYGPVHVDVALARMERKFGVSVRRVPVRLAYRETLRGAAGGLGRHVKQSGGHGQYGIARIDVEPLPRGEGFVFDDRIVGGAIPRTYIPSVEVGIRQAMAEGIMAGYPVVDVRVVLVDGKYHTVDSSDMAFQAAGRLAFREAAEAAGTMLLEPVMDVHVTVPDELTGAIMGDLSARRGRIHGTDAAGPGRTRVHAHVPEGELATFTADLRSLTGGAATFTMTYDHHDTVPDEVATRLLARDREQADAASA